MRVALGFLAIGWPFLLLLAATGWAESREAYRKVFPPPVSPEVQRPRRAL